MKSKNQKEKKRKQKSIIEQELLSIMQKSLKTALDQALDEIFKGFK